MAAKDERVIAARRVGKTDGHVAPYVWMASQSMPGMLGAWVAVSRQQGFGKTIPSTMAAMERMFGFVQGVHFGWSELCLCSRGEREKHCNCCDDDFSCVHSVFYYCGSQIHGLS